MGNANMAGLEISPVLTSKRIADVLQPYEFRCSITNEVCREGDAHVLYDSLTTIKQTPDPGYIRKPGVTTDGQVYSFDAANKQVVGNQTGQSMTQVFREDAYNPSTGTIVRSWWGKKTAKCARTDSMTEE